jgi:hypothetical protein
MALPAFVDEVPDYEVRDGRMRISMGDFALIMPVHVFVEGCLRGKAAVAKWRVTQIGKVSPLR